MEWVLSTGNCGGAGVTLQAAYNNSSSPQITLDAVHAGLIVRDNSTPIGGNLLAVQNNTGGTTYFAVTTTGTSVAGSSTASGNINSSGGGLQTGGTTRVDNTGNLVSIGTITSGDINGQTISSSANFTGSVTVASSINANTITPSGALTVGATGQSFTLQGNASSTVTATGGGFATTIGFTNSPVGAVTYNFDRSVSAGTYTICTTVGNCAGSGTGVTTAGGTTNKIAKFTAGQAIGNSSISDTGSSVSITPGSDATAVFQVQNAAGHSVLNVDTSGNKITLGNVTSTAGQGVAGNLIFADGTNDNFGATLSTATLTANRSITIPNADGTVAVSASGPLSLDAAGNLTCPTCVTSGGGSGGTAAVDSLDGLTGTLTLANSSGSGTTVTINNASTSQKGIAQFNSTNFSASSGVINTIQDISSASSPTFAGITVNTITQNYSASSGTGNTLSVADSASSGTTTVKGQAINITGTANNTGSNTITGLDFGNVTAATNNTYYGINFGTGFNDLLRYNGTTLITGGGLINGGQLQSGSVANGSLANSSLTVTAGNGLTGGGSVSLGGSTSLAVSYGSSANTAVQGNTTLTCASGTGNLTGGGNAITLGSGGTCNSISTINNPTFTGQLTLSGNGSAGTPILNLTGTPTANATTSLVQLGGAIASGNNATNGGTYLGINLPASGAGSAADFLNFQNNGTVALKVTNAGGIVTNLSSGAVYSNSGTLTSEANLSVTRGGTGAGSFTSNGVLYGNSTGALQVTAAGTSGQCLVGNTGSAPSWTTCTGLVTLQNAYNNSTNPEITLGSASTAGLTVRDNSSAISGNLLEVQNNAGSTSYFAVSSTGVSTSGNATVSGSVLSSTLDTASAGALSIGNTNATSIALGKTGSNIGTTINGTALVKPTSGNDSTTAFQVQNASATSLFNVDTTNTAIGLGYSATQVGYNTRGGNLNSSGENGIQFSKITTTSAGTMSSIAVYFANTDNAPNNKFQVALYADNAGAVGAKIASGGDNTITPGTWNTASLSASLSASTSYWIGINQNATSDTANETVYDASGGTYRFWAPGTVVNSTTITYGAWPSTFTGGPAANTSNSIALSTYANVRTSSTSYTLVSDANGHVAVGTGTTSSLAQLYVTAPNTSQYAAYFQGQTTVNVDSAEGFNVVNGSSETLGVDTIHSRVEINGSDTSANSTAALNVYGTGSNTILNLLTTSTTSVVQVSSTGATTLQNSSNSTTALQVENAAGTTSVLTVDTTNHEVIAAGNTSSVTSPILALQQAGSGDTTQLFSNATASFYQGIDASNSNSFNINSSTAAAHGSNLGNDLSNLANLTTDGNASEVQATQFTASSSGTMSSISAAFSFGAGDAYSVGIFSDSSGSPGTLLGKHTGTGTVSIPNGSSSINWNTLSLDSPVSITNGTKYWLALETDASGPLFYATADGTGSSAFRGGVTAGTWGSNWTSTGSTNDGTGTYHMAIYGAVTSASITDNYANTVFNLTQNGIATFRNVVNSTAAFQILNSAGTAALTISTDNVSTGANAATATVVVGKDGNTSRSINAAGTINASGADYAEYFRQATPGDLQKGDLVCLNDQTLAAACSTDNPGTLVGAVSSNPGYVGNDIFDPKHPGNTALVGLMGQVEVNVSDANGAIHAGDALAMSSMSGVAVKATAPGTSLGTALENFSGGTGQINVYLHVGYYAPTDASMQQNNTTGEYVQNGSDAAFASLNISGHTTLSSLTVTGAATIADLTVTNLVTAALTVNGHIVTGGGQPTIAVGDAACNAADVSISGTDTSGLITITTTGGCTASGALAKATFAHAYTNAPHVTLTPANADAAGLKTYIDSAASNATSFTLATPTSTINGSTTYKWYYQVLQ